MKNNYIRLFWSLSLFLFLFTACDNDDLSEDKLVGLWKQVQVTEDGTAMTLTEKEKNLRLLIEGNGVYRSFTTDGVGEPVEKYGTWFVTDDKWLDITMDTWHILTKPEDEDSSGTWGMNHIVTRFTVLSLTDDTMELRIKTYIGEKKYAAMFVENERPDILMNNVDDIELEFKQLKTYIYTFRK